jgi:hypothetical protein
VKSLQFKKTSLIQVVVSLGKVYNINEVIGFVWQHSRYHGNLLAFCDKIAMDGQGHAALIYLFNLSEMVFKDRINNYDANLISIITQLKEQDYINEVELHFLNNPTNGVRKFRNLLAHSNLSKYNVVFLHEDGELMYPFTENETCIKLYTIFSKILFNLILRIVSYDFKEPFMIYLDDMIREINLTIKEISPENLLEFKGIDFNEIEGWNDLTEVDRYRIAENCSDVNMWKHIFTNILDVEDGRKD